ncbi:MAG: hypothetical protein IJF84_03305 [Thermoguttaceae bacterium]|nr:hypothetical protein [Thermoguttaceae bacterium]
MRMLSHFRLNAIAKYSVIFLVAFVIGFYVCQFTDIIHLKKYNHTEKPYSVEIITMPDLESSSYNVQPMEIVLSTCPSGFTKKIIPRGSKFLSLRCNNCEFNRNDLKRINSCNIPNIFFIYCYFKNPDMPFISDYFDELSYNRHLRSIVLTNCSCSLESVAATLSTLSNLEQITLYNSSYGQKLPSNFFNKIQNLTNLNELHIIGYDLSDCNLDDILSIKSLKTLSIKKSNIKNQKLIELNDKLKLNNIKFEYDDSNNSSDSNNVDTRAKEE